MDTYGLSVFFIVSRNYGNLNHYKMLFTTIFYIKIYE